MLEQAKELREALDGKGTCAEFATTLNGSNVKATGSDEIERRSEADKHPVLGMRFCCCCLREIQREREREREREMIVCGRDWSDGGIKEKERESRSVQDQEGCAADAIMDEYGGCCLSDAMLFESVSEWAEAEMIVTDRSSWTSRIEAGSGMKRGVESPNECTLKAKK
jgi:hypothetical protein